MNKRVVVGILSYIIFIYWCTTHTTTTNTPATNNTLFTSSVTLSKDDNSPRIRVLIARAVGPSEAQNVIDDVQHETSIHMILNHNVIEYNKKLMRLIHLQIVLKHFQIIYFVNQTLFYLK